MRQTVRTTTHAMKAESGIIAADPEEEP